MTENRDTNPSGLALTKDGFPSDKGTGDGQRASALAVTSGKGGVGKTSITLNLAIELSRMGRQILLIDADLGLANVDIMLGISPKHTLENVLRGECSIFDATIEGPEGLTIVSAASGLSESESWRVGDLESLQEDLARLERGFDTILIDTGAGISSKVTDLVLAADSALIVAVPEPTSIADAYAMIKVVSGFRSDFQAGLVVNRARSPKEAYEIHDKFNQIVSRFLSLSVRNRGYVLEDRAVEHATRTQHPFVLGAPQSQAARCITDIARDLGGIAARPEAAQGLFHRLFGRKAAS